MKSCVIPPNQSVFLGTTRSPVPTGCHGRCRQSPSKKNCPPQPPCRRNENSPHLPPTLHTLHQHTAVALPPILHLLFSVFLKAFLVLLSSPPISPYSAASSILRTFSSVPVARCSPTTALDHGKLTPIKIHVLGESTVRLDLEICGTNNDSKALAKPPLEVGHLGGCDGLCTSITEAHTFITQSPLLR